jgi:hypothetical protein
VAGVKAMVRPRVTLFCPGQLVNPLNGAHGHWSQASRYRKTWRAKVKACWLASGRRDDLGAPTVAKRVWLAAYTWNVLDHDGLHAALKPILDGLVDAGVLHSDAPSSGHSVIYSQQIRRGGRGVEITVEAL